MGVCVSSQSESVGNIGENQSKLSHSSHPSTDSATATATATATMSISSGSDSTFVVKTKGEIVTDSNKIDSNLEFGKLLTFYNVKINENHECTLRIESNNIEYLFLSCYDPICFVFEGPNVSNIKKVIIGESTHCNQIRKAWFPNGTLPYVKGIDTQIVEFGENYCYYEHLTNQKERNIEIENIKNKYQCQIIGIVRKSCAPAQMVI